ncbi:outer membrane protein beta-barrel family protein [Kordia sp. SMS9]|uniref:outer membrane beta-barrel protein n=1 Tax=Kordia sp. SMS9 TaxID=2282170 RepID=UPI000E0CD6E1|nr:outer membrane beta-barrel protein [Kordia sp. SMS9]AXG70656.1 outer membrane protein beta-barrel family protein [Kordia sp. SMS9]
MLKTLLHIILLLGSYSVMAQSTITGNVMDNAKQPLSFSNVVLYENNSNTALKAVIVEENGTYTFSNVKNGTYVVEASLFGYKTERSIVLNIDTTKNVTFDFILKEDIPESLDEVLVVAKKPVITQNAEKLVVNLENSEMVNSNVRDIVKKIPGVLVTGNNLSYAGQSNIRILINGKQTNYMDMQTLLREMPADNIAKVELIQQPGAEYDADGAGALINIILKKNVKLGTYGTLKSMIGYVDDFTFRKSASIASFKGKINWQAGASYSRGSWREDLQIIRRVGDDVYDQFSRSPFDPNTLRLNAGLDYYINKKHTAGMSVRHTRTASNRVTDNITNITSNGTLDMLETDNRFERDWELYVINPYYEFDDEVNKLTLDFNYVDYKSTNENNLFQTGQSMVNYDNQRYFQDADYTIYAYQADYKRTVNDNISVHAGLKYSNVDSDSDLQSLVQTNTGEFVDNPNQTNRFLIDEDIMAAYAKVNVKLEDWAFSGGLRWEQSETIGTSQNLNTSLNRTIAKFFPSLSITRNITEELAANVAYSYRIQRPSYSTLNPFVYYYDPFTFEQGNPTLRPALTNSFRFNLTYENQPFFSVSYNKTDDTLFELISQNDATSETSRSVINLAKNENWSFSLFAPLSFVKGLEGYTGVIVNYNRFMSEELTPVLDNKKWNMTWFTSAEYKLPWGIQSEVSGYYTSGGFEGQIEFEWIAGLDIAFSKKFMNDQLKVSVELEEILDRKFNGAINYDNVNANIISDFPRRNVFLQLSYSFGKKYNKKKNRKNSAGDEVDRIKTQQ